MASKRQTRLKKLTKKLLAIADDISLIDIHAKKLAEHMSHAEGDANYVSSVSVDTQAFRLRLKMVTDMLITKTLLEVSGLGSYTDQALRLMVRKYI